MASLEKHFWRWAALFLALILACSLARDVREKMWIDELYTLHMAKQASAAETIHAILEGSDGQPPAYDLIVRPLLAVIPNEALAIRLPSTLGFCVMVWCLMAFGRRRLPPLYALLAALLACDVCLYYASEGRGYGMVLGCAAGALLSWQAAIEGRRRGPALILLALCLSLMVALHYFAIFFLGPLLVAELVRARHSGRPDFGTLAALAPALLVLGLHYPLIAASADARAHYWSPANIGSIMRFYRTYLYSLLHICSVALIALAVFARSQAKAASREKGLQPPEWAAMIALALLPPVVVAISMVTTHVFVEAHLVWVVIAFAVLAAALLWRVARGNDAVGLAVLAVTVIAIGRQELTSLAAPPVLRESQSLHEALSRLPDGPEPIAISAAHPFLELAYYEGPRIHRRLVFPASRELDVRYRGFDTDTLILLALRKRSQLAVVDYETFLAAHPRFLLGAPAGEYLPWRLAGTGYRVTPIPADAAEPILFEVEVPKR